MALPKRKKGASNPPVPGKVPHEGQGGKANKARKLPNAGGATSPADGTVSKPVKPKPPGVVKGVIKGFRKGK